MSSCQSTNYLKSKSTKQISNQYTTAEPSTVRSTINQNRVTTLMLLPKKFLHEYIRRICNLVDKQTLTSVHNALVPLQFEYCSQVQDTLGFSLYNKLQKLQNRAARVVLSVNNDTQGSEALGVLGWELLQTRQAKSKAVKMYKVVNGLAPN